MSQNSQACAAGAAAVAPKMPAYEPAAVVRHIAHELRQPLSTIESIAFYLDMVLPRSEGKARRQLGKLQKEVHQINWILTDAIHFLRAAPPNLELLDLSEAVSKSLSEWDSDDAIGLCLRLDSNLPLARLDLEQIQHLLRNVVTFFSRISSPGRAIVVRSYAAEQEVFLEISSNAQQYSADDIRRLFEPFDAHLPGGLGLALASVRRIAEAHGATVTMDSIPAGAISVVIAFPAA